jgi:hypothetical protein
MVSRKNDFVRSMMGVGISENDSDDVHFTRFAVLCAIVGETPFETPFVFGWDDIVG